MRPCSLLDQSEQAAKQQRAPHPLATTQASCRQLRKRAVLCVQGSIPYVPFLRAPYYVWVGRVPALANLMTEAKVEAPSGFPPTFLYTMSWEDPRPDMKVGTARPIKHVAWFKGRLQGGNSLRHWSGQHAVQQHSRATLPAAAPCQSRQLPGLCQHERRHREGQT